MTVPMNEWVPHDPRDMNEDYVAPLLFPNPGDLEAFLALPKDPEFEKLLVEAKRLEQERSKRYT